MTNRSGRVRAARRLIAAAAVGLGTFVPGPAAAQPSAATTPAQDNSQSTQDFEISGEAFGLYPGSETLLETRVNNPQDFTIQVTSIEVTVFDANPDCPAALLTVSDLTDPVNVAPGTTETVALPLQLAFDAPDACQGATWPLELYAVAAGPGPEDPDEAPLASPDPDRGILPRTGSEIIMLAGTGLALIATGTLARYIAKRLRPS